LIQVFYDTFGDYRCAEVGEIANQRQDAKKNSGISTIEQQLIADRVNYAGT
jgi:hypothetical protein